MSLVFNLADSFKLFHNTTFDGYTNYNKYWLAGFQLKPRHVESYGHSKMIVVQFKTIGAFAFFKEPLHHFTNEYILLDDIEKYKAEDTWEQLQACTTFEEMFRITEKFLYQNIVGYASTDLRVVSAIKVIAQTKNKTTIDKICDDIGVSRKHLNHLFKEFLGVSPKTLITLYRFQNVLRELSKSNPDSLTSFAYDMEYFDQSHFSNEFKAYSGLKPSQYVKLKEKIPSLQIVPHFIPQVD